MRIDQPCARDEDEGFEERYTAEAAPIRYRQGDHAIVHGCIEGCE
jgi:hypothetical protein